MSKDFSSSCQARSEDSEFGGIKAQASKLLEKMLLEVGQLSRKIEKLTLFRDQQLSEDKSDSKDYRIFLKLAPQASK